MGSVVVIFVSIVLFILVANLLVGVLKFLCLKLCHMTRELKESATQTSTGDGDVHMFSVLKSGSGINPQVEAQAMGSGRIKKKN